MTGATEAPTEQASAVGQRRVSVERTLEEQAARALARRKRRKRRGPWVNLGQWIVGRLPLPVAAWFGNLLGLGVYLFSSKARTRTLTHLEMAFGDEKTPRERKAITRESLITLGRGLLSLIVLHRQGVERTLQRITCVNEDVVRQAIAEHGSCLIVGGHFAMLDLSAFHAAHSLNALSVTTDAREGSMSARLMQIRQDLEVGTVQRGDPRELIRAIKSGRPVGLAIDHDVPDIRGVFLPFFGRPSYTAIGPGSIAVRMKIPMVFARAEWDGLTRHKLIYGPVLHARTDLPKAEAAMELMARATAEIERQIRARPEDWMWIHRRWDTTPESAPDVPIWTGEVTA